MKNNTRKLIDNAVFEVLEDRRLMSGTLPVASLSHGVLSVTDNNTGSSKVIVDLADNNCQLTVDVMGKRSSFAISQVSQINITAGNASEYLYINPAIDIPADITAGNGNDTIRGDGAGDQITAGNGNDLVYGKGPHNVIQLGSGNDSVYGTLGHDSITVGDGTDSITLGGGADVVTAGSGNDYFLAGNGGDTITTGTGHDVMIGGANNKYLYGKNIKSTSSSNGGSVGSASGGSTSTGGSTAPVTPVTPVTPVAPSQPTVPTVPTTPTKPVISANPTSTPSINAPVAIINLLAGPRVTGMVVSADGLASKLGVGTATSTSYVWNFGDTSGANNQITGFNGGHVYDQPGKYTITLTVTDSDGQSSVATQQVSIAAATRNIIYVDPNNGSDSNAGTLNAPLQSLPTAFARMGDNTEILLRAGSTFNTNASLHINGSNVLIGRYGVGANPIISRSYGNGVSIFASYSGTNGLTIQDITFTSPYGSSSSAAPKIGVSGIYLGGQNCTVRDCTFLNLDDAVNENGSPVGTLIENNTAPQAVGLRGYFVWGQGSEQVIIGNYVAGTTQEHNVRLVGVSEVTVEGNNFTNHDGKGCIEMHEGQYAWIMDNSVTGGDIRLGPLGLWGESASSSTDNCVIEDNQLTDTFIYVNAGTHNAVISNNVINNTTGEAVNVMGTDNQGRTSSGITIVNNTAVDSGTHGNFITVWGWVNGIVMENNVFIAPHLQGGSQGSSPVYVNGANLNVFTLDSDNIWPVVQASGGSSYIAEVTSGNNYLTISQWNKLSNVKGDIFENVTLKSSYQLQINSVVAGAEIQIAA
jgi:hypothetical protein